VAIFLAVVWLLFGCCCLAVVVWLLLLRGCRVAAYCCSPVEPEDCKVGSGCNWPRLANFAASLEQAFKT